MGKTWMVLGLLVSCSAWGADLSQPSNNELCVRRATALIVNQPVFGNTEREISAELQRRNEPCADSAFYTQVAEKRILSAERDASAQAQLIYQQQSAEQLAEEQRSEERAARIRAAGRAYLELQQQQRDRIVQPAKPVETTCRQTNIGTQCTTW